MTDGGHRSGARRDWRSDWAAVAELRNPRDGFMDRHLNRYLSRPITVVLARTPVTPNQVTIAAGVLGIVAGWLMARGGYWPPIAATVLLQFSAVLDDVDGELARLTRQFSPYGDALDITVDTLTQLAVFAGIAVAVARMSGPAALYGAGGALVAGVLICFPIVTYLERRVFPAAAPTPAVRRMQRYVEILSSRDSSVIVFAAAVTGHLEWFLWGAAVGAHVFWISLLWLWRVAAQESVGAACDSRRKISNPSNP